MQVTFAPSSRCDSRVFIITFFRNGCGSSESSRICLTLLIFDIQEHNGVSIYWLRMQRKKVWRFLFRLWQGVYNPVVQNILSWMQSELGAPWWSIGRKFEDHRGLVLLVNTRNSGHFIYCFQPIFENAWESRSTVSGSSLPVTMRLRAAELQKWILDVERVANRLLLVNQSDLELRVLTRLHPSSDSEEVKKF